MKQHSAVYYCGVCERAGTPYRREDKQTVKDHIRNEHPDERVVTTLASKAAVVGHGLYDTVTNPDGKLHRLESYQSRSMDARTECGVWLNVSEELLGYEPPPEDADLCGSCY